MSLLGQALKVARQRMASGLTGADLRNDLQDIFSQLDQGSSRKLANRIAKEEYFLGHAAHDPNLYANCHEARKAKVASENNNLMVLTYKTPVCSSCTFNRKGSCSLMGGKLISSSEETPEIAVQRTADIMSSEGMVSSKLAGRIAAKNDSSPLVRLQIMHKKRLGGFKEDNSRGDTSAQISARRTASILEPAELNSVRGKNLSGPSARRAANTEDVQIEAPELTTNRTASKRVSEIEDIFRSSLVTVHANPKPGRQTSRKAEVESFQTTTTLSPEAKRANRDVDEDNAIQAQQALHDLSLKSSRLLANGQMTTTLASKLIARIQTMEDFGARHSQRTARLKTQLSALSGGLEY